ncbi:MAG: hypothetical protein ABFC77_15780 [Thermoguttaceae bacterium]
MRCFNLRAVAVSATMWMVLGSVSALHAADLVRQPNATTQPESLMPETSPVKTIAAESDVSNGAKPTPAKNRPKISPATVSPDTLSKTEKTESVAKPAAKSAKKSAGESLLPIPDPMESGPVSIEAASFKGVIPGVSTKADVEKAWGSPKEVAQTGEGPVQLYSIKPFRHVEVHYAADGKVASVIVRFDRAFPAEAVAKQLDLATIRPVLVSNEVGEVLGLAYPERGVLFAFEVSEDPQEPSMKVSQLVLEPISAEPFVLRAQTMLENRCDLSQRDLEQALILEPDNARAHWLQARVLTAMEKSEPAAAEAAKAVKLDPKDPHYRATYAQCLAQLGRLAQAMDEAERSIALSDKLPHVKARSLCLIGNLIASGPKPDYKKALSFHSQAIQAASPLLTDPHPSIRIAAKEVLIDAHLGAAHDIAWGDWKEKSKSVTRWIERAQAIAEDLMSTEGASSEQLFRVHTRAMAAYVGIHGGVDPETTIKAAVRTGDALIESSRDPAHKAQIQWDLGMALYDALQVCQMRSDYDNAVKCGEKAAECLAAADQVKHSPSSAFLLGRLYFRIGAIHAARDHDHKAAIAWFDKAMPLLDRLPTEEMTAADLARHGESLVSMGVSYWQAKQERRAVALTQKGIRLMEQAVEQGSLASSSLTIPYNNLSAMHRKLGNNDQANRFEEMASRTKEEKLK